MTYQQFLDWVDEETHVEWVNGKLSPVFPKNVALATALTPKPGWGG